jgi:hypothetical protein
VNYDDIAAIFLVPNGTEGPSPEVESTPARRLRDASEAIATIGWWSRSAAEAFTALGHGFFDGYVWGRAAALGSDVSPAVVVSAFGVFNPPFLASVYTHARTLSSRSDARARGAAAGLREATPGLDQVIGALSDRLRPVLSSIDAGSRPLFAALQALPWPDDPHGRLWRAAELIREHRGDGHLAACLAADLTMAEMNVITELWLGYPVGGYSATRGFDTEALASAVEGLRVRGWVSSGSLSASGLAARTAIEATTDAAQEQLVRALGNDLDDIVAQLQAVSAAVVGAHAAPADPRKRAAG